MVNNQKLSAHFSLLEMSHTEHRNIDNTPTDECLTNLKLVCEQILEPCRDMFGPIWVHSGYRCLELNDAIGGSKNSAHMQGLAVDFVAKYAANETVFAYIRQNLRFDQLIDEQSLNGGWIHVGLSKTPRQEVLRYDFEKKIYLNV
jgi:zinc D-Ala-D-Ala carboxypeptidase